MNTIIKRIELIDEFCKNGKLEPFRELITKILDEIHDRGVQVSIRYDVDFANFKDFAPAESKCIRVSLKNVKDPLEIIWVLFREYGHFLSHPRGNGDSQIAREELIKNYSELNEFSDRFERCKKNA